MPSKYLFLSNADKSNSGGVVTWNNIPTLSESTRECYVSILDMDVLYDDANPPTTSKQIFVRMNLPSLNYYSTTNTEPVMRYLSTTTSGNRFIPNLGASVELLTNDNLKKIEVQLFDNAGLVIPTTNLESINLTLKLDYVDQQAMTQQYLSQKPMTLN